MKEKLLVITTGTVAAGVGYQLQQQIKDRPNSDLILMVRYLDIATNTPNKFAGGILANEWKPMQIVSRQIDALANGSGSADQKLTSYFYPGLLPHTEQAGGGGIRYIGAGAVLVNHDMLEAWIEQSMVSLAQDNRGPAKFSIALIASPVGATGSGSMERLVSLIVSAASRLGLGQEVHCNVFVLHPGKQNIRSIGWANTLAFYAEMAATRIAHQEVEHKGRTIILGWGIENLLNSLAQFQEAAATHIRLLYDPRFGISTEYRQSEVDHTVLIGQDRQALPSHLSTATIVTLTLGDLEEQIVRHDMAHTLALLVNGDKASKSFEDEANIFGKTIKRYFDGATPQIRYRHLLEYITRDVELDSQLDPEQVQRLPESQQRTSLQDEWNRQRQHLKKLSQTYLQERVEQLAGEATIEILQQRRQSLKTGYSLARIQRDYARLQDILADIQLYAQEYHPREVREEDVQASLHEIGRVRLLRRRNEMVPNAMSHIQDHINSLRLKQASIVSTQFLSLLQEECRTALSNLSAVTQGIGRNLSQQSEEDWHNPSLRITTQHQLQMPALTEQQIHSYYEHASAFGSAIRKSATGITTPSDGNRQDPLVDLRRWLFEEGKGRAEVPFQGNVKLLTQLVEEFVRQKVHDNIKSYSVLDALLGAGEEVLAQRLDEAAHQMHPLIRIDLALAPRHVEMRHVSAYCKEGQRTRLLETMNAVFGQGGCTLIASEDPTEIVICYYIDGISMAAISDLTGSCLKELLDYRKDWYSQVRARGQNGIPDTYHYSRGRIPLYSGKDAEKLIFDTGVIREVYNVRDQRVVSGFNPSDFPELQ